MTFKFSWAFVPVPRQRHNTILILDKVFNLGNKAISDKVLLDFASSNSLIFNESDFSKFFWNLIFKIL